MRTKKSENTKEKQNNGSTLKLKRDKKVNRKCQYNGEILKTLYKK